MKLPKSHVCFGMTVRCAALVSIACLCSPPEARCQAGPSSLPPASTLMGKPVAILTEAHTTGAGSEAGSKALGALLSSFDTMGLSLAWHVDSAVTHVESRVPYKLPEGPRLRSASASYVYRQRADSVVLIATPAGDMGAGVVIREAGLILTNWHVVSTERQVFVLRRFDDPAKLQKSDLLVGTVVSLDRLRDLALVRVQASKLPFPPVPIAPSRGVEVGSDAFAIGHPEGLTWSLTEGVVSQVRKDFEWSYKDGSEHKATVIQTQTSINPGSSGGPLFDSAGGLIGISSFSREGESLHFAVASDEITDFLSHGPSSQRLGVAARTKVEPKQIATRDLNKNGKTDAYGFDADGDGSVDYWLVDSDEDGKADAIAFDRDDDGKIDTIAEDRDADGKLDYYLLDTDGDGKLDTEGFDVDGDGTIDSYRRVNP